MRGEAIPNSRISDVFTTRAIRSSRPSPSTPETSASGKWIVASATRSPPPVSIITGLAAWPAASHRCATNSVCPGNRKPVA